MSSFVPLATPTSQDGLDQDAPGEEVKQEDDDFEEVSEHLAGEEEWEIKDRLPAPVTKYSTTAELHELIHQGLIKLDPHYQRDVVWNEKKQSALIDSLLRNYFIPPLVFAVRFDEDSGEHLRVCVDGKQRLTSIQKFIDGHVRRLAPLCGQLADGGIDIVDRERFKEDILAVFAEWEFFQFSTTAADRRKRSRQAIPERCRKDFLDIKLACVEYYEIEGTTERDIFQRVQMGVPLTAAEKLQAIDSPWSQWIFTLRQKFMDIEGGIGAYMSLTKDRGRDFQNLAHMIYCIDNAGIESSPTAGKTLGWIQQDELPSEDFKAHVSKVLVDMLDIASDAGLTKRPFQQPHWRTVAPIEFVFCGVLLSKLADIDDINFKAEQLYELRKDVRRVHKDVRANSTVCKTMWAFIAVLESRLEGNLGNGSVSSPKKSRKRGREDDGDDLNDLTYRPSRAF